MCKMFVTDAGTTQDNFILPAPPVGGLSISQDRLDKIKRVFARAPFQSSSEKVILVRMMFRIISEYTKIDLAAESVF